MVVCWSLTNCLGPIGFLIPKMARRFLGLEMKSLNDLYLCLRPLHAAPGDRVANSGDLARAIVFVLSGHVHLYKARTLLPDCSLLDRLFYGPLETPAPPPVPAPPRPRAPSCGLMRLLVSPGHLQGQRAGRARDLCAHGLRRLALLRPGARSASRPRRLHAPLWLPGRFPAPLV